MSELNVGMNSSGFVGVNADSPTKRAEPINTTSKQENNAYSNNKSEITTVEVNETIEEINNFLQDTKRNLSFSVDENSGTNIIMVKDAESDEVIRQMPSEELLVLRKKMDDVVGILFDKKV